MPQSVLTNAVSADGRLTIIITQESQDREFNISRVRVEGRLTNAPGASQVSHFPTTIDCAIGGDGNFNGPQFGFNLFGGEETQFISRVFALFHDNAGHLTVHFTVSYGITGLSRFPDNESISNTLVCDDIPQIPTRPGQPQFSDEKPTSLTVTWAAPSSDGGGPITDYILRRYDGTDTSGPYRTSSSNSTTRHLTDLDPGNTYTFTVIALNGSRLKVSPVSLPNTITTVAGSWIRVGGKWKKAIPYVRTGGKWKQAIPHVRSGGVWKKTG